MTKDVLDLLEQTLEVVRNINRRNQVEIHAAHAMGNWSNEEYWTGRLSETRFWGSYITDLQRTVAGIPVTRILRDGEPVAEFTDASLARMALVMFQSNEAANGNTAHAWTLEGQP